MAKRHQRYYVKASRRSAEAADLRRDVDQAMMTVADIEELVSVLEDDLGILQENHFDTDPQRMKQLPKRWDALRKAAAEVRLLLRNLK